MEYFEVKGTWKEVANAARTTVGKGSGKEPSPTWKKRILLAEHSPIRQLIVKWKWSAIKYWVSVHFVRHKIGIEHFVKTQRTDRTGEDREEKPQGSLVAHECIANAQALINISRKRLCNQASPSTRQAWMKVIAAVKEYDPVLASVCVPECIYRGFCPEMKSCGFADTPEYGLCLEEYRKR